MKRNLYVKEQSYARLLYGIGIGLLVLGFFTFFMLRDASHHIRCKLWKAIDTKSRQNWFGEYVVTDFR